MSVILVYPDQIGLDDLNKKYSYLGVGERPKPHIALGMLYMAAYYQSNGIQVEYIDNSIRKMKTDDLAYMLLENKPALVGFGGTFTEWFQAKQVSEKLMKNGIVTVYGGPNAIARPEKHRKYFSRVERSVDYNIVNDFWPARSLVNLNDYSRTLKPLPVEDPTDIVLASVGCSYGCKFCSTKTICERRSFQRDPGDVKAEIEFMKKEYGTRTVHFREDNFAENSSRLREMCDMMAGTGLKWVCQIRIGLVTRENISMMQNSGCVTVHCGWESANDDTLEYINKGHTVADMNRAIKILESCRIAYAGGFMVGLPNETEKHIRNTMAFVRRMRQSDLCYIPNGAMRFLGYPVSELYEEIMAEGLVDYDWNDGELLIPRTKYLTAQDVSRIMTEEWVKG